MTTATVVFAKGDRVSLVKDGSWPAASSYGPARLSADDAFIVTRVTTNLYTIKREKNRDYWGPNSFNVSKDALVPAKPPVDLTAVPAGAIAPDDPRLEWLWERSAALAKEMGLCGDYDKLVDKLGGLGREREITVKIPVNGVDVSAKIKARSRGEAERLLKAKLGI